MAGHIAKQPYRQRELELSRLHEQSGPEFAQLVREEIKRLRAASRA